VSITEPLESHLEIRVDRRRVRIFERGIGELMGRDLGSAPTPSILIETPETNTAVEPRRQRLPIASQTWARPNQLHKALLDNVLSGAPIADHPICE
jgi:hypothetical protein